MYTTAHSRWMSGRIHDSRLQIHTDKKESKYCKQWLYSSVYEANRTDQGIKWSRAKGVWKKKKRSTLLWSDNSPFVILLSGLVKEQYTFTVPRLDSQQ